MLVLVIKSFSSLLVWLPIYRLLTEHAKYVSDIAHILPPCLLQLRCRDLCVVSLHFDECIFGRRCRSRSTCLVASATVGR